MNLKYNSISAVLLDKSDTISFSSLNKYFNRLLGNDQQFLKNTSSGPKIWECRWYNANEEDKASLGYDEGECFWYNTEPFQEFIQAYSAKIYAYAKQNGLLKDKIKPYNGTSESFQLYKSIVNGYTEISSGIQLEPLFDIGKTKDDIQIKISKVNNNIYPLSDDNYWRSLVVSPEMLLSIENEYVNDAFDNHIDKYHVDKVAALLSNDAADYLKIDLSNVKNIQSYKNHVRPPNMTGYDAIETYEIQYEPVEHTNVLTAYDISSRYILNTAYYNNKYIRKLKQMLSGTFTNYNSRKSIMQEGQFIKDPTDQGKLCDAIDTLSAPGNERLAMCNIKFKIHDSSFKLYPVSCMINDYALISSNISQYDVSYDILQISTSNQNEISNVADLYDCEIRQIPQTTDLSGSSVKWCKRWKSGYIEFGGIIKTNKETNITEVDLTWAKDKACRYNYPLASTNVYGGYRTVAGMQYDNSDNIKKYTRYVVQLTPIMNCNSLLRSDNDIYYPAKLVNDTYVHAEILDITNEGFKIGTNENSPQYYSYYVSGFRTK